GPVSLGPNAPETPKSTVCVGERSNELSQRGMKTKSCTPRSARWIVSRPKKVSPSPRLRKEKPVPPRPFCTASENCEYHVNGITHDNCAPTPRKPSGPSSRPWTSGASTKSHTCGCCGLRRPNGAKNCPPLSCNPHGRVVV